MARSVRSALVVAGLLALPVVARARSLDRIAARVDLTTGALTTIATSSVPTAVVASPSASGRARATVVNGTVTVTDSSGVAHVIASVDRRSWLTWQVEMNGVLAFAVRTFDAASPRDGHDVVRAVDASGAVLWDRVVTGWIPSAFEIDGALALASPSALELVDVRTKTPRCTLAMLDANSWPSGVVAVGPTLVLYQTHAKTYAMDPRTCTRAWSAPTLTKADGALPALHAGHVFTSAEVHTSVGGAVTITERDAHTGAVLRTFGPIAYRGAFDEAETQITFVGNAMYVLTTFTVLDR